MMDAVESSSPTGSPAHWSARKWIELRFEKRRGVRRSWSGPLTRTHTDTSVSVESALAGQSPGVGCSRSARRVFRNAAGVKEGRKAGKRGARKRVAAVDLSLRNPPGDAFTGPFYLCCVPMQRRRDRPGNGWIVIERAKLAPTYEKRQL